jgi:hypothetical protein
VRRTHAREAKPRAGKTYARTGGKASCSCVYTVYTVLHTLIDVHRLYVPFWLLGVVGADLRPDMKYSTGPVISRRILATVLTEAISKISAAAKMTGYFERFCKPGRLGLVAGARVSWKKTVLNEAGGKHGIKVAWRADSGNCNCMSVYLAIIVLRFWRAFLEPGDTSIW